MGRIHEGQIAVGAVWKTFRPLFLTWSPLRALLAFHPALESELTSKNHQNAAVRLFHRLLAFSYSDLALPVDPRWTKFMQHKVYAKPARLFR
jgi:hypothetical protein